MGGIVVCAEGCVLSSRGAKVFAPGNLQLPQTTHWLLPE